ncbi:MAG: hypothetical protein AB2385_01250 [Symbiobacterium sp.]|uniref:hypothetical protein n=1 Tax=Symbiobacterium sp. TaxID=1971213 RepID=UPI003464E26A
MAHRSRLLWLLVAAGIAGGMLAGRVMAQGSEPGTGGDPLVTRSFVEQYVEEMAVYRVVNVSKGQRVIGEAGTEMVLRSGRATAIVSELGGLLDATQGIDTPGGAEIPKNHLIVVPRSDGRGFYAETNLVLMVKGKITIETE